MRTIKTFKLMGILLLFTTLALLGLNTGGSAPAIAGEKLAFAPGVVITTAVEKGDAAGNDYEFILTIKRLDSTGFTYDWTMSAPKNWKGKRVIRPSDLENAHMLNDFYYNSSIRSLSSDYSSVVWPRAVFARIKKGEPVTMKIMELSKPVTRTLQSTGSKTFSVIVNEEARNLPVITCRSQDGATYTILDDEAFPLGLGSKSPKGGWGAQVVSIRTQVAAKSEKDILAETGRLTAYGIHFHTDSAELRQESEPVFREIFAFLREHPKEHLVIEGHTDAVGTDEHNIYLSKQRAESVKRKLTEGGVDPARLSIEAYGESRPVSDNNTVGGRALNRRVVFVVKR